MITTEFLLTSLIVVLVPGAGVIYTISIGMSQNRRAAVAAAIGCTLGIVPHLVASVAGLSFILHMSATVFQALKWIGTAYLLYLAWRMWQASEDVGFGSAEVETTHRQIITRAVLINLLNPKLTLFFVAFLPLFIAPNATVPTLDMVKLSLIFMLLTLAVFIVYGLLANWVKQWLAHANQRMMWLNRAFAATFAVLGIKLALTD